ncbi:39S ribosomal protein L54, mitochondrial [Hondaea fermentalgiana]|uniref:Large ribosomal subunit protein mL54 n=1 Tax=Hondaea fermentalgiana TaxID=2315210 RepID=A0A2R5G7N9_9STRA|nr:39S ribosomal protein L54, mitochondrial [Hondaea fermentalgiana]|eukprot:GBG27066.1 39S ribosomal protein L54, mitochondrial [Hondaea fermentalgiana]
MASQSDDELPERFAAAAAEADAPEAPEAPAAASSNASSTPPEDRGVGEPGKAVPVNIFKSGSDPVLLAKDEYPEWLFDILKPPATEREVLSKKDSITWKKGGAKYFRKLNKRRIKENNMRGDAL